VPDLRCFRAIQLKYPGATFDGSPNLPWSGHHRQLADTINITDHVTGIVNLGG
jgi:hypothetical protein